MCSIRYFCQNTSSSPTDSLRRPSRSIGDYLSIIQSKRYIKKVALVGDASVGKTSLIRRFVVDVFDDKYIATIGTKVSKRDFEYKLPDKTIYLTLMMWDILGQKEYSRMRTQGMSGSHGIIFVADLNRPETVKSVEEFWLSEILKQVGTVPSVLVGNKYDLVKPDAPTVLELKGFAEKNKMLLLLTSAKTGEGVEALFRKMGEMMLHKDFGGGKTEGEPPLQSVSL